MEKGKSLVILRHAKSSWEEEEKSDFDRALKPRGINDIVSIAHDIKSQLGEIDAVYSSSANRAIHTAILFAKAAGIPTNKIRIVDELYETHELNVLEFVKSLSNDLQKVVIVGHNPTSTDFVNMFISQPIDNIPTSGLVKVDFRTQEWAGISELNVENVVYRFPSR